MATVRHTLQSVFNGDRYSYPSALKVWWLNTSTITPETVYNGFYNQGTNFTNQLDTICKGSGTPTLNKGLGTIDIPDATTQDDDYIIAASYNTVAGVNIYDKFFYATASSIKVSTITTVTYICNASKYGLNTTLTPTDPNPDIESGTRTWRIINTDLKKNVYINNNQLKDIYFNTNKVEHLYFNNNQIF